MTVEWKKTQRGFRVATVEDTRTCLVRIQESSSAEEECVWIFCDDPNQVYRPEVGASPHLNRDQARSVAEALLEFANGITE